MTKKPREKLSVILIVKNEAERIRSCLDSVKWADEIVILDSGSTDATVSLCQKYTSRVMQTDWPGFGIQKQRALDLATHKWVLSIDADEILTPELQAEIQATLENPSSDGYFLRRQMLLLGSPLRYGGWGCDWVLRLVRKDKAHFTPDLVHESLLVEGSTSRLTQTLWHASYPTLSSLVAKTELYSDLSAKKMQTKGRKGGPIKGAILGLTHFLQVYLLRLGLLDGQKGLLFALFGAWQVFLKYTKLGLMEEELA